MFALGLLCELLVKGEGGPGGSGLPNAHHLLEASRPGPSGGVGTSLQAASVSDLQLESHRLLFFFISIHAPPRRAIPWSR